LSLSSAFNQSVSESRAINQILNLRSAVGYILAKKHNFNLGMVVVNRHSKASAGPQSFTEFTGTLTYSYSF
jgi:hypothetical protein